MQWACVSQLSLHTRVSVVMVTLFDIYHHTLLNDNLCIRLNLITSMKMEVFAKPYWEI